MMEKWDRESLRIESHFDKLFAETVADLSPDDRALILEWQKTDRTYEKIQRYVRTGEGSAETPSQVAQLARLIGHTKVDQDVTVFRGVRNFKHTFGFSREDIVQLLNSEVSSVGFTATSTRRVQAFEFTQPDRGDALLKIRISKGTPALWVAGAGAEALKSQGEPLLGTLTKFKISGFRHVSGILEVDMEVI